MTPRLDAPMNSTSLRSSTSAASLSATAHASSRHSASSVEQSCSPRSQTTMGPASGSAPSTGGQPKVGAGPDKDHGVLLTSGGTNTRYQGLEYRPGPALAGPARRGLIVPARPYTFWAAPAGPGPAATVASAAGELPLSGAPLQASRALGSRPPRGGPGEYFQVIELPT